MKPYQSDNLTWSTSDYKDLMYHQRRRQRLFVNFFDQFTAAAPNVKELVMPFDWSPRSVRALSRLQELRTLVLEKYFIFQSLEQGHLDNLLGSLPNLRNLDLEVWTPSGRGLQPYYIESKSLRTLDISQCRGFYLQDLHTPSLKVFKVSLHNLSGPLASLESVNATCLHQVLSEGAPNLTQINDHVLHPDWRDNVYPELDSIMNSVCSCRLHKQN